MRNPLALIRWLVLLAAIALGVWFYYTVFVKPGEAQPEPSPSPSAAASALPSFALTFLPNEPAADAAIEALRAT